MGNTFKYGTGFAILVMGNNFSFFTANVGLEPVSAGALLLPSYTLSTADRQPQDSPPAPLAEGMLLPLVRLGAGFMGYVLQSQGRQFSSVHTATAIFFLSDNSPETSVLETVELCTLLRVLKRDPHRGSRQRLSNNNGAIYYYEEILSDPSRLAISMSPLFPQS